jgi:hypothetical protein
MAAEAPTQPPIVFKDAAGRDWFPMFCDDAVAEVKRNFAIDLDRDIPQTPGPTVARLFANPSLFAVVLLIASYRAAGWDEAIANGPAGEEFLKGTRTDETVLDRAMESLVYALARRYRGTTHGRLIRQALVAWCRVQRSGS